MCRPTVSKLVWRPWTCCETVNASRNRRSKAWSSKIAVEPGEAIDLLRDPGRLIDGICRREADASPQRRRDLSCGVDLVPDLVNRLALVGARGSELSFELGETGVNDGAFAHRRARAALRFRARKPHETVEHGARDTERDTGEHARVDVRGREFVKC